MFQSTHPIRVRLAGHQRPIVWIFVSIHAPVQSATSSVCGIRLTPSVSIHAPVQGAVLSTSQRKLSSLFPSTHLYSCDATGIDCDRGGFNPRTRKGCDPRLFVGLIFLKFVSIHAPLQGATIPFQHSIHVQRFQSTPPYRVRPTDSPHTHFNPRTPTGATALWLDYCTGHCASQFTHPYRMRHVKYYRQFMVACLFQSTHPYRMRQ